MVGLLRGIIKRPTEMKNGNFTCASSMSRLEPKFWGWVDENFYLSRSENVRAHN